MGKTLKDALEENRLAIIALERALKDCRQMPEDASEPQAEEVRFRLVAGGRRRG